MRKFKYLIVLFGVLDLITLYRFKDRLFMNIDDIFSHLNLGINIFLTLKTVMLISLVFTFFFALFNKKAGLIIYYFQLPFRFLDIIFTFGFLYSIIENIEFYMSNRILYIICSVCELLRLGITIRQHSTLQRNNAIGSHEILDSKV